MDYYFRNLSIEDYNSNYFDLLNQLSNSIDKNKMDFTTWTNFINNLDLSHQIIVMICKNTNKIIASGTILFETKIIHNFGIIAHIEDIVIDEEKRGFHLGLKLIKHLIDISRDKKVYKIILDCSDHNIGFYEKCGFIKKGCQMAIYYS